MDLHLHPASATNGRTRSIGRFVVLGSLHVDGMGSLVGAYDPQLDRKVALRVLDDDGSVREAQATARLGHPNVLAVHEVGSTGDATYMVMEQVSGMTLRAWLGARRRGWAEILDVLVAAGGGLAAAHRAGVAHDDFGPDAVLVADDGRPRVMGFSAAGCAREDQRAFCATVWEAIHGEPPPARPRVPVRRRAPSWLYRVLVRGLRHDERWPSLDALVAELRRGPRRAGLVSAAVAVAVVAALAFLVGDRGGPSPAMCAGARVTEVWNTARKEELRAAFRATGLPYADAAYRATADRLDGYARALAAQETDACRATRERRQSEAMLDRRMSCLDRRRAALGALTRVWTRGMDGESLSSAAEAAAALPSPAGCADARELGPAPGDPARVVAAQQAVDEVRAFVLARRLTDARARAPRMRALAREVAWPRVAAEAAYVEANLLALAEDPGAARALLEASRLAGVAHDDKLGALAMSQAVICLAQAGNGNGSALLVADLAEPLVARAGDDPELRLELMRNRAVALRHAGRLKEAAAVLEDAERRALAALGPAHLATLKLQTSLASVAEAMGDYGRARDRFMQVLAASLPLLGEPHPQIAVLYNLLGIATGRVGDAAGASALVGRAVAIRRAVFGPDANVTLAAENNLAVWESQDGRRAEAIALLEHVRAVRERLLGPDHPRVAMVLDNIGVNLNAMGRSREALELHLRVLPVLEKALGAEHLDTAETLVNIAHAYEGQGDAARALDYHRRALAVRRKLVGDDHPATLQAQGAVARALALLGRCDEARQLVMPAIAALERKVPPGHEALLEALTVRARCELAEGKPAVAEATLARVLAAGDRGGWPPVSRGAARFLHARSLWALARRPDALAEARRADAELAGAPGRQALRTWLAPRERLARLAGRPRLASR